MEINPYENIPGLSSRVDTSENRLGSSELGQTEFLELMTTELANQDPLEPMDNNEFMSQIAQFSAVEGINDLVAASLDLATNLQSSQALQATNIIGRDVLVSHNQGYLPDTGSLNGAVELSSSASDVAVNIYDASGEVMGRVELGPQPAGLLGFNWDGVTLNGQRAPQGRYQVEVEATYGSQTESLTPLVSANVVSLTLGGIGQEMQVELEHLGQVGFNQVNQIL
ncbi:MAG: flagellar hook assembly protein FlgD [Gammaproteobacteria bacterium]|nr:flagellar hook assembly protein FlgD [Gammaproteobacteria bacterium]